MPVTSWSASSVNCPLRPRLSRLGCAALLAGLVAFGPAPAHANALLFDFGTDATQTTGGSSGAVLHWNNLPAGTGADDFGLVPNLLLTDGNATDISLQMVSRFNGANDNGTTTSGLYPASATRDSLYGNTEPFGGLENITPIFKLTGLPANATYTLTFYASRTGVGDNRETRYTVTGATETFADLDVANNVTNTVTVASVAPDVAGEITISLTPGPNNNNGNHFTYLGVLEVGISTGGRLLVDFGAATSLTETDEGPAAASWNNITATLGADPAGVLAGLVTTNGTATAMGFQMVARFNGANANGTTAATVFPATATQDSLFGNTEAFSGLSNILPVFKLTGLDAGYSYSFSFYASRTGVGDNRETRYTVTGTNTAFADLNAANNTNATVTVSGIRPDPAGEITVALTAGPGNNNANHFTYLGALRVDFEPVRTPRILVDFGGGGSTTEFGAGDPDNHWNNVTTVGATDDGSLAALVTTDGAATGVGLQMVSRFNGVNDNGTTTPPLYVASATRDSQFGNTEPFSGLENITPIFKLNGLATNVAYDFTFYASRLGVGDNRETRYTVTGATEASADLNVANNETEVAVVAGIKPDAAGEITIALTPGPNNDNGNHFTYLGVLQVDWEASTVAGPATLSAPSYAGGTFRFTLGGTVGGTYVIQRSRTFAGWDAVQTVTLGAASQAVEIPQAETEYFYRAIAP